MHLYQIILTCCLFVSYCALAAPTGDLPRHEPGTIYLVDHAIVLDDGYYLTVQGVLGGIVLLLCAILLIFRSLWDHTLAGTHTQNLTGFITMGFVTWIMLANFEPHDTYGTNRLTIYFIVPLIVGVVASFFMYVTIQLYLMLLGGLGGLAFGLWILGWRDNLSITSGYGRATLLTILVVIFMLLSLYHHSMHKLGAALAGSYMLFMGLDIYVHTGFLYCFTTTLDPNHSHTYKMYREVYIMQSCLIIAFLVSYIIQGLGIRPGILYQHRVCMSTYISNPEYNTKGSVNKFIIPTGFVPQVNWRFWSRGAPPPPPPVQPAPVVSAT
ncbi:hypothetical protein G6F57_009644 [Rhizopus arrhizus]|nr:hypothetical protein G6F24_009551 [Rhizopus arrhizus]KAG1410781.1 hypothetical protein G6F58_008918 [Rhizopus delemar]KAG0943130.1 hypothetical protein G6F32_007788 [Rhizopus arrhizus]KAG0948376.1 hypothetical protein G6F30_002788 [Rhizopus arrhizus]KAG0987661.1 hypothetical protein G6F28_009964 [Rhizopus arrhizus]